MSTSDVEVVVIGAGVVGLAVGAACARAGRSVLVLERNDAIALETTSRNSEVVHAGIYYPAGSLKATLCVAGRRALYRRCDEYGVGYRRTGKLIVATRPDEIPRLSQIHEDARANGVALEWLEAGQVQRLEPDVRAVAALLSPETGIVDAHAYAMSFWTELEALGGTLALRTETVAVEAEGDAWRVEARSDEPYGLTARAVVNAAGLEAATVASRVGLDVDACGYRVHYCKGDYFALGKAAGVALSHLVYPVPATPGAPGLGIHATVDLAGQIRLGPDAEYVDAPGYGVDPDKAGAFAHAVSRYLPKVAATQLTPAYAGIRPKLAGPGEGFRDFVVEEESRRGMPGFVNCIGIESPGLTAATAIADRVVGLLASRF